MQGQKGKCTANIKSYSLDRFEQVELSKIQQAASTKYFLLDAKILWNSEKHFSTKASFIEPYIIKIPTQGVENLTTIQRKRIFRIQISDDAVATQLRLGSRDRRLAPSRRGGLAARWRQVRRRYVMNNSSYQSSSGQPCLTCTGIKAKGVVSISGWS